MQISGLYKITQNYFHHGSVVINTEWVLCQMNLTVSVGLVVADLSECREVQNRGVHFTSNLQPEIELFSGILHYFYKKPNLETGMTVPLWFGIKQIMKLHHLHKQSLNRVAWLIHRPCTAFQQQWQSWNWRRWEKQRQSKLASLSWFEYPVIWQYRQSAKPS